MKSASCMPAGRGSAAGLISVLAAAMLLAVAPPGHALGSAATDRAAPSVTLGGIPGQPAVNPRTHTIYVPLQNSDIVDVVNSATCNLTRQTGCQVVARARVGRFAPAGGPLTVAVDPRTDTLYVVNAAGSPRENGAVTVVNAGRCNATVTRGCGHVLAAITVGKLPVAAVLSPRTGTLYVANVAGNTISVINAAGCNAVRRFACGQRPRTLTDRAGPDWVDVDVATDTLYAANGGNGNGHTVSVFNGATCDARTGRGCGQTARTVTVGSGAFGLAVDQASGAVYVANNNDGTISVINGSGCNARQHAGCGRRPHTVTTGPQTPYVAVDPALHTAFAISQG